MAGRQGQNQPGLSRHKVEVMCGDGLPAAADVDGGDPIAFGSDDVSLVVVADHPGVLGNDISQCAWNNSRDGLPTIVMFA